MSNDFPIPPGMTKQSFPLPPSVETIEVKAVTLEAKIEKPTVDQIISETLTPLHRADVNILRFINAMILHQSPTRAAKEIGLNPKDGKNLLLRADIAETIARINKTAVDRFGYTADEVMERMKELAFVDPADCERPGGGYHNSMNKIPIQTRYAIKKFVVKNIYELDPNGVRTGKVLGEIIEIQFHDKVKPLENLGPEKNVLKKSVTVEHELGKGARNVLLSSVDRAQERIALAARDVTDE